MTGFVQLTIHGVTKNVKINGAYYQQNVMDPIFNREILRLYGKKRSDSHGQSMLLDHPLPTINGKRYNDYKCDVI